MDIWSDGKHAGLRSLNWNIWRILSAVATLTLSNTFTGHSLEYGKPFVAKFNQVENLFSPIILA